MLDYFLLLNQTIQAQNASFLSRPFFGAISVFGVIHVRNSVSRMSQEGPSSLAVCATFCISSALSIRSLSWPSRSFKVSSILAYKWLDAASAVCHLCVGWCLDQFSFERRVMSQLAIFTNSKLLDTGGDTCTHKAGKRLH